jgi:hypothetical protein
LRIWPIMHRYNSTIRPLNAIDMRELAHLTVHEVSKQENLWTVFVETSLDTSFSSNFDYMSLFNTTTTTTTSESNDSASPSSPLLVLSPPSSSPQPQLPSFN